MKNILLMSTLVLLAHFPSQAWAVKLVSLSCKGDNGLELNLREGSDFVDTKLKGFSRTFETNRQIFLYEKRGILITRITLGMKGASNVYLYDIYLAKSPVRGEETRMSGVIGHTVYGVIVFPVFPAPVPMPMGFVRSTDLDCLVLAN